MKSKLTITAKIFNPSVHNSRDGAKLYSFSMGISQQNKQTEKWENIYLPVTIYDKENLHGWILQADKKEITIEGQLTVKSGYTKRDGTEVATHIGVFGFEAYIGKKPSKPKHEDPAQAPKQAQNVPTHQGNAHSQPQPRQQHNQRPQRDPVAEMMSAELSETIPF